MSTKDIWGVAGGLASMVGLFKTYCDQKAVERERRQLEEAMDCWENEGGSGPPEVVLQPPPPDWVRVQLVNGNGRWNASGWHPHGELFVFLKTCESSSDENVREVAARLMNRWGFA